MQGHIRHCDYSGIRIEPQSGTTAPTLTRFTASRLRSLAAVDELIDRLGEEGLRNGTVVTLQHYSPTQAFSSSSLSKAQ